MCFVVPGCGSSGVDTDLESLDGLWLIKHGGFGCASLDGLMLENTVASFDHDGEDVSADFTDLSGNRYVIDGTYRDGYFFGDLTVTLLGGRVVRVGISTRAWTPQGETLAQLDGQLQMKFDSEGECAIGQRIGVWFLPSGSSDPSEVFSQCGPVDIVFVMDTSGSMDDEAEALCEQLDGVLAELQQLGLTDIRVFKWGVNEDADAPEHQGTGDFSCLEDNASEVFNNAIVPGTTDRRIFTPAEDLEGDEDWGPAISIVSHFGSQGRSQNFQWRTNAIKIIVPISDEGPSQGSGGYPDSDDAELIALAIENANANDVIVSPIVGSGAEPDTAQHAVNVADGTGGIAVRSTGAELDLGEVLFEIVFRACGGQVDPPGPTEPYSGATMLVAAGRDGGIFQINPTTGATTFLTSTPVDGVVSVELLYVSSMVYNESAGQLWAGTGGEADCDGCIYRIDSDGTAILVSDNDAVTDEDLEAHPGLTYRRSDGVIFGTEGEDDDLWVLSNMTGAAAAYTDDMSDDEHERGNGLTFVGDVLYWAGVDHLYRVDQFTGLGTDLGAFTFTNIQAPSSYTIVSMTALPGSSTIHAILKDRSVSPRLTYVCTINVATRAITVLQPPAPAQVSASPLLDGIAWVPANYFDDR